MGQKTITELQLRDDVDDDVNFPGDDTIQTYRVTAPQIAEYIRTKNRRAAPTALANGIQSKAIVFADLSMSNMPDALYTVDLAFKNSADSEPIFLQGIITAIATTGFTISFNAPTESANYVMHWKANY